MQPPAAGADTLLTLPAAVPVSNAFYGISAPADTGTATGGAIPCVVHETQTLYNGSTVKLRTLQDIWAGTTRIPKGTFVFGRCGITDERLLITLSRVTYNNQLYPVEMAVFDATDGQEGLSVPGALTDNAVREGIDQMTQALAVGSSLDGTVGAQAANAGIQSVTGLLSRKVRNVRVTARAGHVLLLKNTRND
jgi:conjugative transposon TraM protein